MNRNILKQLKVGFEYICKWKFRFSFYKVLTLYVTMVVTFVGGWQFTVNGHAIDNSNINVKDWRVEYGGLDWPTVTIIALITIFFIVVLFYRDRYEVRKDLMKDNNQKLFEEIYVPYFNKLFSYLELNNFNQWSYNICISGDCRINRTRYYKLREMIEFCDQIQKFEGFEAYFDLTKNLKMVLADTLNVFDIHSRLIGEDTYDFHKFYKDHPYDDRNEREEEEEWQEEVFLVSDLFFEFTSLANLLLSKIRELHPSFFAEHGILSINDAKDCNNQRSSIEYREEEVSNSPYPGLQNFLTLREKRLFHYGKGDNISDVLKREQVL